MSKPITENLIEESAIEILQSQGWEYANGKEISPEGLFCERENYSQIILVNRLRNTIAKINPAIPLAAQEAAIQKVLRIASPELLHNNEEFHRLLIEKVKIPYQQNGYERSHEVALIDFENTDNNQFLVVNQYTIIENNQNKRPDVLLFVNGLPFILELFLAFFITDLFQYWAHRFFHLHAFMWRFHSIHHSTQNKRSLL